MKRLRQSESERECVCVCAGTPGVEARIPVLFLTHKVVKAAQERPRGAQEEEHRRP